MTSCYNCDVDLGGECCQCVEVFCENCLVLCEGCGDPYCDRCIGGNGLCEDCQAEEDEEG